MSQEKSEAQKKGAPSAKRDVWKISGLETRCRELINEGILVREGGFAELRQKLRDEFAEKLTDVRITKEVLRAKIPHLVWSKAVLKELVRAIRSRKIPLDELRRQYFVYIPEKMWERKIRYLKGISNWNASGEFVAGVGRLFTGGLAPGVEQFEFPANSYANPIEIPFKEETGSVSIMNGAQIGIIYDPNIENNTLRCALADAHNRGARAVILTNSIYLDVKKTAGVGHVNRAQLSGLHVKVEHLPQSYRAEAERILRDSPHDEAVYQNIEARLLGLLDALFKISRKPMKRGPEFEGPVYYVFGRIEEEIINEAANAELRYITIIKLNRLASEMAVVNRLLGEAERSHNFERVSELSVRQQELSEQVAMTIRTNESDWDRNRQRRRMRAHLVQKVQEVIPNCTVVSQGSAYFKVGGKMLKIHIPSNIEVTDGNLSSYDYGIEVFTDTFADLTVICHPYALSHRSVGREDSRDGVPVTKFIHVAPLCIDTDYLREQTRSMTKPVHPMQKAINNPQFRSGVLHVRAVNGYLSVDALPIAQLGSRASRLDIRNAAYPSSEAAYIMHFVHTDDHFGSRSKRYIWNRENRIHLGVTEAAIEMMRREGLLGSKEFPFHFAHQLDDPTQGNHFGTHNQPDPKQMPYVVVQRIMSQLASDIERFAEARDQEGVKGVAEELQRIISLQWNLRGLDWLFDQMMEVFDRQITPNLDFYLAVLDRFERSKIVIRGISEITHLPFDTRDIGVINRGTGNHLLRTLENKLVEGEFYARHLRAIIGQSPQWRERGDDLKKLVVAPRYSNETFGWGTVKAPGGFEWGIRLHSSPARLSSWSDTLSAVVNNDLNRGDDTYGLLKYVTATFYGDKHFYCDAETARMFYVMCAAGTHTDLYGTRGFPPNNTGVVIVCLPAGGPDDGPVIIRKLPHDLLRDWFAKPKPFLRKGFLPKPV